MSNKYVNFISDEHLLNCIDNLHQAYLRAKNNITKKSFYANKVDTIKLTFDAKFNGMDEEDLIQSEILRQIDKSINNSIGTFHEQVLGGITGYEVGNLSGFDIKAVDNSLFAVFGTESIPSKISDAAFDKLALLANAHPKAMIYYVLMDDFSTTNEKWITGNDEYKVSHKRVYKVSLNQFYSLLTGQENAYNELVRTLPEAIQQVILPKYML